MRNAVVISAARSRLAGCVPVGCLLRDQGLAEMTSFQPVGVARQKLQFAVEAAISGLRGIASLPEARIAAAASST
jgi:hypothetical protein